MYSSLSVSECGSWFLWVSECLLLYLFLLVCECLSVLVNWFRYLKQWKFQLGSLCGSWFQWVSECLSGWRRQYLSQWRWGSEYESLFQWKSVYLFDWMYLF